MNSANVLLILLGFLAVLVIQAFIVARTAKSKGRSFALFLIFGLLSPFLASIFAMFIRPKNQPLTDGQPARRVKLMSLIGFLAGASIEVYGLSQLQIDDKMTDAQIVEALGTTASLGALTVAAAGILLMIASVANERIALADVEGPTEN